MHDNRDVGVGIYVCVYIKTYAFNYIYIDIYIHWIVVTINKYCKERQYLHISFKLQALAVQNLKQQLFFQIQREKGKQIRMYRHLEDKYVLYMHSAGVVPGCISFPREKSSLITEARGFWGWTRINNNLSNGRRGRSNEEQWCWQWKGSGFSAFYFLFKKKKKI